MRRARVTIRITGGFLLSGDVPGVVIAFDGCLSFSNAAGIHHMLVCRTFPSVDSSIRRTRFISVKNAFGIRTAVAEQYRSGEARATAQGLLRSRASSSFVP